MSDVNVSIFTGNLVRDCEIEKINNITTTKLSVACNRVKVSIKSDGKKDFEDIPYFLNTRLWGKMAENLSPYLKKGIKVSIQGHWKTSTWEQNGKKMSKDQFVVENLQFMSSKKDGTSVSTEEQVTASSVEIEAAESFVDSNFEIY